jgi:hypothetical protein
MAEVNVFPVPFPFVGVLHHRALRLAGFAGEEHLQMR